MALYRLFFVDRTDGATTAAFVQCNTDKQAVEEARKKADDYAVAIWQDDRWVGMVKGSDGLT